MIDIKQGDCLELMKSIPDGGVDCILTDPPYNLLKGHKIETGVDIATFTKEVYRVLKDDTFYAFFGRMPSILDWHNEAIKSGFKFKIDIIWNKKNGNLRQKNQLENIVELIWVYKKGNPVFKKINYPYEEVAVQNVFNGSKADTILRQLSFWKSKAKGNNPIDNTGKLKTCNDDFYKRDTCRQKPLLGQEEINIKNIWAEISHNMAHRNPETGQVKHPTVKAIPIMEKLINLTTNPNQTILDPFMGSGTTGIACANLNRNFIGFEIDKDYFQIAKKRIENAEKKHYEKLF